MRHLFLGTVRSSAHKLAKSTSPVAVKWIPSDVGILRNEKGDKVASDSQSLSSSISCPPDPCRPRYEVRSLVELGTLIRSLHLLHGLVSSRVSADANLPCSFASTLAQRGPKVACSRLGLYHLSFASPVSSLRQSNISSTCVTTILLIVRHLCPSLNVCSCCGTINASFATGNTHRRGLVERAVTVILKETSLADRS